VTSVFEPNDEVKGDIARIYFYMATCYQDSILTWTGNNAAEVLGGTAYHPILDWEMDLLMRWSKADPVDEVEKARNAAVYGVQYNRNPFVDYPGLEDYLWGDKTGEVFSYDFYDGQQQDPDNVDNDDDDYAPITEATIGLNNTFFDTSWTGLRPTGQNQPIQIIGRKGNVSVIYAKGSSGQNMYCNSSQIRLYRYNKLTFRARGDEFEEISFSGYKTEDTKVLYASTGTMDGFKWTGSSSEVEFTTDEETGNIKLYNVKVKLKGTSTAIESMNNDAEQVPEAIYSIDGRRMDALRPGLNIVRMKNGRVKKIMVR